MEYDRSIFFSFSVFPATILRNGVNLGIYSLQRKIEKCLALDDDQWVWGHFLDNVNTSFIERLLPIIVMSMIMIMIMILVMIMIVIIIILIIITIITTITIIKIVIVIERRRQFPHY